MNKKISIGILLSVIAIALLTLGVNANSRCDAYGLYDCTSAGGDGDLDGVCTDWEINYYGTDPGALDTDSGGACDGDELFLDFTNPNNGDDDFV